MNQFLMILLGFYLSLSLGGRPLWASSSKENTKLRFALNWKPEPEFGGFFLGQQEGFFKNKDVELIEGGSSTPTPQLVASGKVEFAIVGADELLLNRERGGDLVALFSVYETSPLSLIFRKSKGFKSIEDILSSSSTLLWQTGAPFAIHLKRKYKNFKVKEAPYKGGVGFLVQSDNYVQQGFVFSEPILAEKMGVSVQAILVAESGFNPYVAVVAARKRFVLENSALVKQFVEEMTQAWIQYLENPEKTNAYMHKLNPAMDLETFSKAAKAQEPLVKGRQNNYSKLGKMELSRWVSTQDQLVETGILKKKLPLEDVIWEGK